MRISLTVLWVTVFVDRTSPQADLRTQSITRSHTQKFAIWRSCSRIYESRRIRFNAPQRVYQPISRKVGVGCGVGMGCWGISRSVVIPAQRTSSFPRSLSSFPRAAPRHSRGRENPGNIKTTASPRATMNSGVPRFSRHSRAPHFVIPARRTPSFPRTRESREHKARRFRGSGPKRTTASAFNRSARMGTGIAPLAPAACFVFLWIPASAGMTEESRERRGGVRGNVGRHRGRRILPMPCFSRHSSAPHPVIPADAGIQRHKNNRFPTSNDEQRRALLLPSFQRSTLRHSRRQRTPSFQRAAPRHSSGRGNPENIKTTVPPEQR